jgi:gas vesicle protein
MNTDNKNQNSNWKIFLGLAAGAAAGYWLNSNRGRQWRKKNAEWVSETTQNLEEQAKNQFENVKEGVSHIVENARDYASTVGEKAKSQLVDYLDTAEEKMDEAESAVEKGAKIAKRKMSENTAKIKQTIEN